MRTETQNKFFRFTVEDHARFTRIMDAIEQKFPMLNTTGRFSKMIDLLETVAPKYEAPAVQPRRPGRPRK